MLAKIASIALVVSLTLNAVVAIAGAAALSGRYTIVQVNMPESETQPVQLSNDGDGDYKALYKSAARK